MRKIILLFTAILMGLIGFAQTSNGFNYKALITNNGIPVASQNVVLKFTIKHSSTIIWSEYTNVTTDTNGIASAVIGEGTPYSGYSHFENLNWGGDTTLSVDVSFGGGFSSMVVDEPFKYVPYAKTAERLLPTNHQVKTTLTSVSHDTPAIYGEHAVTDGYGIGVKGVGKYEGVKGYSNSASNTYSSYGGNFSGTNTGAGRAYGVYGYAHSSSGNAYAVYGTASSSSGNAYGGYFMGNVYVQKKLITEHSHGSNMLPLAYGRVSSSGSITAGTGNFTVTKTVVGEYKIVFSSVSDLSSDNTVILATPGSNAVSVFIRAYRYTTNSIYVKTMNSSGALADHNFHFIVYKK